MYYSTLYWSTQLFFMVLCAGNIDSFDDSNAQDDHTTEQLSVIPGYSTVEHYRRYGGSDPYAYIYGHAQSYVQEYLSNYYTTPVPPPKHYRVHCYFTNTDYQRPGIGSFTPPNIDPTLCTTIVYAFAVLDPVQLVIRPYDSVADVDKGFYKLVTDFKSKNLTVVLAVGGFQDSCSNKYSRMCKSHTSRANFTAAIVPFLQEHGFDGLEVQWNDKNCWSGTCDASRLGAKKSYTFLLQELREKFDATEPRLLLGTSGTPFGSVADIAYDIPAISAAVDWISILTYNYHGFCDEKTGFSEQLFAITGDNTPESNVDASVQFWLNSGVPKEKLIVGVIAAGKSFALESSENHGLFDTTGSGIFTGIMGEFTNDAGVLAYFEICNLVREQGWTIVRELGQPPYAFKGKEWISWQDPDTMRSYAKYIKDNELGGASFWNLAYDDFSGICNCNSGPYPLLKTVSEVLRGAPSTTLQCV